MYKFTDNWTHKSKTVNSLNEGWEFLKSLQAQDRGYWVESAKTNYAAGAYRDSNQMLTIEELSDQVPLFRSRPYTAQKLKSDWSFEDMAAELNAWRVLAGKRQAVINRLRAKNKSFKQKSKQLDFAEQFVYDGIVDSLNDNDFQNAESGAIFYEALFDKKLVWI